MRLGLMSLLMIPLVVGCKGKDDSDWVDDSGGGADITADEADCTWYEDADGDGYANPFESVETECTGNAPEGFMAASDGMWDCDDTSGAINPTAEEVCGDLADNNCDGDVDEDCEEGNGDTAPR